MVPLDGNDTIQVYRPSHPIPVVAQAPLIVLVSLGAMAVLLLLAVVVIITSVVVEILAFLIPISPNLPESVSRKTFQFFIFT